jgi:hypothetical protein
MQDLTVIQWNRDIGWTMENLVGPWLSYFDGKKFRQVKFLSGWETFWSYLPDWLVPKKVKIQP